MILFTIYKKIRTLFATMIVVRSCKNKPKNLKVAGVQNFSVNGEAFIGRDFYAGEGFYVSTNKYCFLSIGDSVMFGPNVNLFGGNHKYSYTGTHLRYYQEDDQSTKDIIIENGVWIGANTTVLSGANVSEGSIIGANSLVSHYIPPYVIATGSPAKKFTARFNSTELKLMLKNVNSNYTYELILKEYSKYSIEVRDED